MAMTDDIKELQTQSSAHATALEVVRQRVDVRAEEFAEFKRENGPVLQDLLGFKQAVLGFNAWAKVLAAIAGSAFIAVAVMGYNGISNVGRLDERVGNLDRRVGEVEKRLGTIEDRVQSIDVRLAKLEVTVAEMKTSMAEMKTSIVEMKASNDQNFKAIFAALARIEANQKKGP